MRVLFKLKVEIQHYADGTWSYWKKKKKVLCSLVLVSNVVRLCIDDEFSVFNQYSKQNKLIYREVNE